MSTIYDIAQETGFSPSTVARALSGKGYCSEKAREIIRQAAQRLDYAPVQAAKALKNKLTKKVMFCIPDMYNPYYFSMIEGANRVLESHGYYMVLVHSEHSKSREVGFVEVLRERIVDGIILGSFDFYPGLVQAVRHAPVPAVLTALYEGGGAEGLDCVYVDQIKAVYIAAAELIRLGHRDIVFLGGTPQELAGKERLAGFRQAMADHGLDFDPEMAVVGDFTRAGGEGAFREFLKKGRAFTAVVACNDLMAFGCMKACRDTGLRIPRDVSVISLDNTDFCCCTVPMLSSVDMMQFQLGSNAAQLLLERIEGKRDYKKAIALEPVLVARDSAAKLKK
jgi:DNA-binding LacI/PurR family transcriptional regulator